MQERMSGYFYSTGLEECELRQGYQPGNYSQPYHLPSAGEEDKQSGENGESRREDKGVPEGQEPQETAGKEKALVEDDKLADKSAEAGRERRL